MAAAGKPCPSALLPRITYFFVVSFQLEISAAASRSTWATATMMACKLARREGESNLPAALVVLPWLKVRKERAHPDM